MFVASERPAGQKRLTGVWTGGNVSAFGKQRVHLSEYCDGISYEISSRTLIPQLSHLFATMTVHKSAGGRTFLESR